MSIRCDVLFSFQIGPRLIALKMHHCHITSSNRDWWGGTYKQTATKLTEIQSSSTKNTDFLVSRCVWHYWRELLSLPCLHKHRLQQVNVLLAKATPHCIMATERKRKGEPPPFALLMQSAICLIVFSLCVSRLTATTDPFSLFSRGCCDDDAHSGMKTDVRGEKKNRNSFSAKSPSRVSLWSAVIRKTCSLG